MRTVKDTDTVNVKVSADELIEGKWLNMILLSKKLAKMEETSNTQYKSLRNKMYNSAAGGKFNIVTKAGLKFIDIENPMKGGVVSALVLTFKKEG